MKPFGRRPPGHEDELQNLRAECERRRTSEERYRNLVEATSDYAYQVVLSQPLPLDLSPEAQIEWVYEHGALGWVNEPCARAFGFERAEELTGLSFRDVLPRVPQNLALLRQAIRNGHRAVDVRSESRDRAGRRRIMVNNIVGRVVEGRVVEYLGTARDITALALLEEEGRAWEERFRRASDAAGALVYEIDLEGKAPIEVYGLKRLIGERPAAGELTSAWWEARVHPDDRARWREAADKALAGQGHMRATYRVWHARGEWIWVEDSGDLVAAPPGEARRLVGAIVDVTEREMANERLRRSEEHYRMLFEENPHPMWIYDTRSLQFLAVNQAALQLYGYTREEFLAMTILDIRPPRDRERVVEELARVGDQPLVRSGSGRHLRKDGTPIEAEITAFTLRSGESSARLVLVHDTTPPLRRGDPAPKFIASFPDWPERPRRPPASGPPDSAPRRHGGS